MIESDFTDKYGVEYKLTVYPDGVNIVRYSDRYKTILCGRGFWFRTIKRTNKIDWPSEETKWMGISMEVRQEIDHFVERMRRLQLFW